MIMRYDGGIEVFALNCKQLVEETKIFMKMIVCKKTNKVVGIHGIGVERHVLT